MVRPEEFGTVVAAEDEYVARLAACPHWVGPDEPCNPPCAPPVDRAIAPVNPLGHTGGPPTGLDPERPYGCCRHCLVGHGGHTQGCLYTGCVGNTPNTPSAKNGDRAHGHR